MDKGGVKKAGLFNPFCFNVTLTGRKMTGKRARLLLLPAGVEETNLEVADLSCLNWLDSCNRTPS